MGKRIDDERKVLWAVLPSPGLADPLAQGAAKTEIGNRVGVRRMDAYISVAGPELTKGRVIIFRCQCAVGEEDDGKWACTIGIINFDGNVFIARRIMQCNVLDRKY